MKILVIFAAAATAAFAQEAPNIIKASPILNGLDTDQNGLISGSEIAGAPAQLRKLDKNGDGKLTRDEAGLQMQRGRGPGGEGRGRGGDEPPPAAPPSVQEMTSMLMAFDKNHDGKLQKTEVPERLQGLFERGDTNQDGVLTRDEIAKLAEANQKPQLAPEGRGGGRGRGPNQFDLAFAALDTDSNGEISAEEIDAAPVSLKKLDKNGDGQITNDEVMPNMGGRGRGGPDGPRPPQ